MTRPAHILHLQRLQDNDPALQDYFEQWRAGSAFGRALYFARLRSVYGLDEPPPVDARTMLRGTFDE